MKRTNIYLSEKQLTILKDISKEMDISVSEIVRNLIKEHTDKWLEKDGVQRK